MKKLVLAAVIALSPLTATASAAPANESYRVYFHDAAMTQYAGEVIFSCASGHYRDGAITSHVMTIYEAPCAEPPQMGTSICQAWDQLHTSSIMLGSPGYGAPCPF